MGYIGKIPTVGNFVKIDSLTASSTASYVMQVDGVNFSPESVNHMLVSLNGVIQAPTTSYTISGSTITFASALTSSDSIDFIMVYGNVLDIGTPSDATVTNAKTNFVSTSSAAGLQIKGDGTTDGTLQLNCSQNSHGIKLKSPPHSASASYTLTFPNNDGDANQVLTTDGSGGLSFADAGGGRSTLLATTTLGSTASQFDMTDVMTNTYNNYLLVFYNAIVSVDGADLRITFFTGSGTNGHLAGGNDYRVHNHQLISDGTDNSDYNTTDAFYRPNKSGIGNAGDESFNGQMLMFNMRSGSKSKLLHSELSYTSSSGHVIGTRSEGIIKPTTAITGLRFEVASGTMNNGTWKLYGLE